MIHDIESISPSPCSAQDEQEIGFISKILRSSFVDGPGNRTVVFLQGCNFRCRKCHNPQTQSVCLQCGQCVSRCPSGALSYVDGKVIWDESRCTSCDTCINFCPHYADPRVRRMKPQELWAVIEPWSPFISGVTVTGGEPAQQLDFLIAFFGLVKAHKGKRLTTCLETNGSLLQRPKEKLDQMLALLDYALVDFKAWEADTFARVIGTPARPPPGPSGPMEVMKLLEYLARPPQPGRASLIHEVRQVVIPGLTDQEAPLRQLARWLATQIGPEVPLRLLRFRPHGTRGEAGGWGSPSDELMARLVAAATEEGLRHVGQSL
ncbi:putative YjjW family glycine radical enzyme activase [Paratrimastix pyriformis]|uniref:YjjW family glycine radical enzyme activase n=1 Tax=Paratrimastix pyriformis TaxID=342808 RepID=A0ABQ8UEC3_9EUKA|nr:putative YjjW family glycine radical enzyme activase [Paratrimastix pyriformis]